MVFCHIVSSQSSTPAFLASQVIYLQPRRQSVFAQTVSSQQRQRPERTSRPLPTVTYRGKVLQARYGENLRRVLLRNGCHPHNSGLLITCKGIGTCGTCAVAIEGCAEPVDPSRRELVRLSFPPHTYGHSKQKCLRLACQVRVVEDISVEKYDGFWGHGNNKLEPIP